MLPTNDAQVIRDLKWFVNNCVSASRRNRWAHILIERPDKAAAEMHKFDKDVDGRSCRNCSPAERERLISRYLREGLRGTCMDGKAEPAIMLLQDAMDQMGVYQDDMIFCASQCNIAIFFHHDNVAWICSSKTRESSEK